MSNATTKSRAKSKAQKRTKKQSEAIKTQLQAWAHEGSRKSLDKIIDFINREKDEELRAYAEIARGEAGYFYYAPNSDEEENDFLTAKQIMNRELECIELKYRIEAGELAVQKESIDIKINEKLMREKGADQDWKYRNPKFYAGFIENRLEELKEDLKFNQAWIKAARKTIKNKKYIDIPFDMLSHIHLDIEDLNWMDDSMEPDED